MIFRQSEKLRRRPRENSLTRLLNCTIENSKSLSLYAFGNRNMIRNKIKVTWDFFELEGAYLFCLALIAESSKIEIAFGSLKQINVQM